MQGHHAFVGVVAGLGFLVISGCASVKQSDTARTGMEQLLISNAVDKSLDQVDFKPIADAKVFLETKYLDCVDKNYITVALHNRLLRHGCKLVDKAEDAQVVCEVASGSVGTDHSDLFVGMPDLPVPSVALTIPRMPFYTREKSIGTAKLQVVAYDATTKQPVINSGFSLARSDARNWHVMGMGGVSSGTVPEEIAQHTGQVDGVSTAAFVRRSSDTTTR
jgi:hypothetical protein